MKRIKSLIVGLLIRISSSRQTQDNPFEHMHSSQNKLPKVTSTSLMLMIHKKLLTTLR